MLHNGRRKAKIVCCPALNFPERRSSAPRLRSSASRGDTLRVRAVTKALGFVVVVLLIRSGSIVPCILTHGVLNALSVFAPEPDYKTRCVIFRILIVLAAAYAAYLLRRLPPLTSGESCVRMEKNTEGDLALNALELDTVLLSPDRTCLEILDQTLLPGEVKTLHLSDMRDIWEAIYSLRVRGAPAIGVCAGYALALAASQIETEDKDVFFARLRETKEYLASARPTAVNLFWALDRMWQTAEAHAGESIPAIRETLFAEAQRIRDEDVAISRSIGELGFGLLHHGDGILTHCNAGTLATAKYGTATAPMYIALEHGWNNLRVYCDETRPLLQGARLTALEMHAAGLDTTLLCDNAASSLMQTGKVNIIFVGCDRVARNGDAANKIGTSAVAILAKHYGIPFYVCAPSSTIDMSLASGAEIPIEQRAAEEVTEMWYKKRMAPEGVGVYNPAFDVTDHSLITGIITERGICTAPFEDAFGALGF